MLKHSESHTQSSTLVINKLPPTVLFYSIFSTGGKVREKFYEKCGAVGEMSCYQDWSSPAGTSGRKLASSAR